MKLFLHQAKHEVRQLGWGLLVWAAAGAYLLCSNPEHMNATAESILGVFGMLVSTLLVVMLGGAMVAKSVQLDAPADSSAFWRTRPLPVRRLLAIKLAVHIGIFVVLPVVAMLLKAGKMPVQWRDSLFGLSGLTALILVNAALGSITKDLGRYLVGVLMIFFGFTMSQVVWLKTVRGANAHLRHRGVSANSFIEIGFIIVLTLAILVCQYRYRRPWISYALAAGGVVGFVALRQLLPG